MKAFHNVQSAAVRSRRTQESHVDELAVLRVGGVLRNHNQSLQYSHLIYVNNGGGRGRVAEQSTDLGRGFVQVNTIPGVSFVHILLQGACTS